MPIRITEEDGVRYLEFGAHWIQGAMRLRKPWHLELEYGRAMMLPLLVRPERWPRNVLQVGLGAGALAKFLYRHRPQARIEVVEIDAEVALLAWQCFGLPDESVRFRVEIDDAYRHVAGCGEPYDLMLIDGFDSKAEAGRLDSAAFYRNCRARLAPGGTLVANLIGKRRRPREGIERLRRAFDGRIVVLPPNEANTIVIASTGEVTELGFAELRRRARQLRARTGLDLLPVLSELSSRTAGKSLRF